MVELMSTNGRDMANSTLTRPIREPSGSTAPTPVHESTSAPHQLAFARDEPPTSRSSEPPTSRSRQPGFARRAAGPLVVLLAVAATCARQVISNATVPTPLTDAEAALGANAYAFLNAPQLRIPGSLSDTATSWQLGAYSVVSSASDRHDSLVGAAREFVLLVTVLTAILTVLVCRRLLMGWASSALAVAVSGAPAAAALARIISVPGALAAFWIVLAAASAVVVADRRGRRDEYPDRTRALAVARNWLLITLCAVASTMAVLTAGVASMLLLGLVLAFVSTRPLDDRWTLGMRGLAILSVVGAIVGASWLTVWRPSTHGSAFAPLEVGAAAIATGGLVLAVACGAIAWLRPLALGAVPILLAAVWPGPAQVEALVLGLTVVAVLAAGALDSLLRRDEASFVRGRRFAGAWVPVAASLLAAGVVGAVILPSSAPALASPTPGAEVAAWIDTQLAPDAVIEVDALSRAQLVLYGLDPDRLSTTGQGSERADLLLLPLGSRTELPLIATFGGGAGELGLRLRVDDPADFADAQIADRTARSRFGTALTRNPHLSLGASAAAALRAGDVDPRLMVGLATASASVRFGVTEFSNTGGTLVQESVFRQAVLTDITDLDPSVGASGTSPEALRWLGQFFRTQQPPYLPLVVVEAVTSLTVSYAAPSPLGLLP